MYISIYDAKSSESRFSESLGVTSLLMGVLVDSPVSESPHRLGSDNHSTEWQL